MLEVADLDDSAAALEYTLGSVPANGELRLSGTPLPVGGHFTQADIDTTLVSYLHDGSETTGDAFTFTVSDERAARSGRRRSRSRWGRSTMGRWRRTGRMRWSRTGRRCRLICVGRACRIWRRRTRNWTSRSWRGRRRLRGRLAATGTNGVFSFNSAADFNGTARLDYRVSDRGDPDNCAPGPGCDAAKTSATQTSTIAVGAVNDGPVAADGSDAMVEDGAPLQVDLRGLVSDLETADANLDFEIVAGPAPAAGSLAATGTNGVFSFNSAADFNGTASFDYRVSDRGDPDNCAPGPGCDAAKTSATHTFTIAVGAVNDGPVAADGSDAMVEDGAPLQVDLRGLVSDLETADANLDFEIVAGPAPAAGSLAATGTNGVFSFNSAADFNGTASFDYRVSDRGDPDNCAPGPGCDAAKTSATHTFTIAVAAVNDSPAITSNGGGDNASLSVLENTTAAADVDASDPDAGDTLSYSIGGGLDASAFSIDSSTGELLFQTAPNFEAPGDSNADNVYEVDVVVSDGALSDSQALSITVTDQVENQAPVITSNGGGAAASVSVVENTTAVTDVDATDPNAGDTLTYTIAGGADQALFHIDGSTGLLTFSSAPDFEAPADANGDNVYDVDVSVGDGALSATQSLSVTVTDADETPANQPPAITSDGGGDTAELAVDENATAVGVVAATDPEGTPVAYSIGGGADAARFAIDPTSGALSFVVPPDYEEPADQNADNAYEVLVRASDGSLADVQSLVVRVGDVNERPTGKLVSGLVTDEDVALVLRSAGGQAMSVADPDRTATAVRVALSVSSGTLTIPRRGGLSFELGDGSAADRLTFSGSLADVTADLHGAVFTPAADAYGIVTLTLGVSDPDVRNLSETSDTTIVVRPVNDPPVLEPIGDLDAEQVNGHLHGPCARHRRDHVDVLARRRPRRGRDRPDDGRLHVEARRRAGARLVQLPRRRR